ncbi:SRPBCC domain-containing protein [Halegenticoccus soli]|uniref:SRPBCC domain-containing protein n=1 Tax=Halegenticoccus soli TaxID=1985678 RepID=UPI000C6CDC8D|nr:SRPBCC domain-containing protein [Halegenticoccus soli]
MHEIRATTEIDAPPEIVWRVLTAFDRYPEWNPFLTVVGRPNYGAHLVVEVRPPGRSAARFRPTVTAVERGRELRWLGHLFAPGLFDGEHRFALEPLNDGDRTRFVQSESFRGALAGPLARWLGPATERGFREMNGALKERAEAAARGELMEGIGADARTSDGGLAA